MVDLILASNSPRRAWLLQCAGVAFRVVVAGVDETRHPGEAPEACALRLAQDKRDAVLRLVRPGVVVAADTVVALDGDMLEKPHTPAEAKAMLMRLSGRTHQVHTGVAVGGPLRSLALTVTTEVTFRALSDGEMDRYVATGEPMDKAGGYGIQGDGGALVDTVRGSYTAVVGLPVRETLALLAAVTAP